MSDRLDLVLAGAVTEGVLPEHAERPAHEPRPWPVVLLIAFGAWLAAVPLLGTVGLMLGELLNRSAGPYGVGVVALCAAMAILRTRNLALFVEQLAVPVLLVGAGSLGFGLFRDLPVRVAVSVLALVALTMAIAIARPWLRGLLGAAAAILVAVALTPQQALRFDAGARETLLLAAHAVLGLWLLALWLQHAVLTDGSTARQGAALESIATGWLVASLAGLAVLSGATFLVGATFGGGFVGDVIRQSGERGGAVVIGQLLPALSMALTLAAASCAMRAWPTLRRSLYLAVALVLIALAWFMPALGAVLLVLALTAITHRFLLTGAAAVTAAWVVGSFYYQLHWDLATKAAVLASAGAVLGALAWAMHFRRSASGEGESAPESAAPAWMASALIVLAAFATLAVANFAIWQKEALIARGTPVFVALAPVDPRSLMQGDFMRLNFGLPREVTGEFGRRLTRDRLQVVARLDARGVATVTGIYRKGTPLAADELKIELTPKNGRWIIVTDAWFFKEGDGARWETARFGEFRVDANGRALLVGMADAALKPIQP